MANGFLSQFPDLTDVIAVQVNVADGFPAVGVNLPADPSTLTQALTDSLTSLQSEIPTDPGALLSALETSLNGLGNALPKGQLQFIQDFLTDITQAVNLLAPLRDLLLSGDTLGDLKDVVLEKSGDPTTLINNMLADVGNLIPVEEMGTLQTFVSTIRDFEADIPTDPEAIAAFLANSFLGVPLDLLAEPSGIINGFHAGIEDLVDAARLNDLNLYIQATANQVTALTAQIDGLDLADAEGYQAIIGELGSVQRNMSALHDRLVEVATAFQANLANLDPGSLVNDLNLSLINFPEIQVAQVDDFVSIVTEPFKRINAQLDEMTPAELAQVLSGFNDSLASMRDEQGFDEIKQTMLQPFADIGAAIEDLNLAQLRTDIEDFLGDIGAEITNVTNGTQTVKDAINGAGDAIELALGSVESGGATVGQVIDGVKDAVEGAFDAVPLQELQDQISTVIGQLAGVIDAFEQALDAILTQVREFVGLLENIDLRQAAQPAFDLMHSTQETLKAIDLSFLGEAQVGAFRLSINVLTAIDLGPVRQTILDAFDEFDPLGLIDDALVKFQAFIDQIAAYKPDAFLEPLVAPFEQMLDTLRQFDPGVLLDPLIVQLETLKQAVLALESLLQQAIAPLAQLFDQLRAALDELAPTRLLAPLGDVFADLMALYGKLDLSSFLDELNTLVGEWLEQALSGLQATGDAFSGADDLKGFVDEVSSEPGSPEFGFMPGDILRPVADVYNKIVALLNQVPEADLLAAFNHLQQQLVGGLDAIVPAKLAAQATVGLQQRLAAFNVFGDYALVADLFAAYGDLVLAFDKIDEAQINVSVQSNYQRMGGLVLSINPSTTLTPLQPTFRALDQSVLTFAANFDVSSLGAVFGSVGAKIEKLIPPFLTGELTASGIQEALDSLNPGHLADEVNEELEQLASKLTAFGDTLVAELPKIRDTLSVAPLSFLPSLLKQTFNEVYLPLKTQLEALNPDLIATAVEAETFVPLMTALDGVHPNALLGELDLTNKLSAITSTFDTIIGSLQGLRATLATEWHQLLQAADVVNPANFQALLDSEFAQIQTTVTEGLGEILDMLERVVKRLRDDLNRVLEDAEVALDDMLAAIPA